jgi:HSP20 family protein
MLPAIRNNGAALATPTLKRLPTVFDYFDRFFEDAFAPLAATPSWGGFPMSMWEDENAVHVEIDAPGVGEKDIELTIHDGDLIVRGERKAEENRNGYDSRVYGRFAQRVALPAPVDADRVEAKLANGVLTVTCPKSEAAKPRKIAIAAPKEKSE